MIYPALLRQQDHLSKLVNNLCAGLPEDAAQVLVGDALDLFACVLVSGRPHRGAGLSIFDADDESHDTDEQRLRIDAAFTLAIGLATQIRRRIGFPQDREWSQAAEHFEAVKAAQAAGIPVLTPDPDDTRASWEDGLLRL